VVYIESDKENQGRRARKGRNFNFCTKTVKKSLRFTLNPPITPENTSKALFDL
jgi:hypothetical protein